MKKIDCFESEARGDPSRVTSVVFKHLLLDAPATLFTIRDSILMASSELTSKMVFDSSEEIGCYSGIFCWKGLSCFVSCGKLTIETSQIRIYVTSTEAAVRPSSSDRT